MARMGLQLKAALLLMTAILMSGGGHAQYFGKNKPGYKTFEFDVYKTPHFEIYHYLDNDTLLNELAVSAEKWYRLHQRLTLDTFKRPNPIILYNHHADFQQTNVVNSMIGVGTGGVTENIKNRVVMPVSHTLAQTDHVLGHELVHAFQFHLLTKPDSARRSLRNLPLWMVEGMAEYFSIGSHDPHTAMWMRDALLNNDFPTLKEMTRDQSYFPYRYGQAFWATVGKVWGDGVILPLFMETARVGYERAMDSILNMDAGSFSSMWEAAMRTYYEDFLKDTTGQMPGEKILSEDNAGTINISPAVSPDGRYVAFFSEKNVFTLDLFLYDTREGKIVKKLYSITNNHEVDNFNFIESSGTWSPDGKQFAFVIFSEGVNKLAILDVQKSKLIEEIKPEGVPAFINPAWSPDGKKIVVSGLKDGINDLYLYNLETGETKRLTRDYTSNIHPYWSPDGKMIVFATEKIHHEPGRKKYSFDLAIYFVEEDRIQRLEIFPGSNNFNPLFSKDHEQIYFVSDPDGIRNLYRYNRNTGKIYKLTGFVTGVTGITEYSPAFSMALHTGKLVYTHYYDNDYRLFSAHSSDFEEKEVVYAQMDRKAAKLPPAEHTMINLVDKGLMRYPVEPEVVPPDSFKSVPYRPEFRLDHISNVQGGVSAGRYGTGMAGSVNMRFSDIVGDNMLYATLALNGQIYDFGGQVAYLNQKYRINWGASVAHIPYRSVYTGFREDTITINDEDYAVNNYIIDLVRLFQDKVSLFGYYPLSKTRRIEAGASVAWYYYRIDRYNNYYTREGIRIGQEREKRDAPDGFNLQQVDVAYVEDNSFFGMTAPMMGHRARFQLEKYFGVLDYFSVLSDYRKYFFINPVNFSFRIYHYGRYGKGTDRDITTPLYLGYPWLVRGYESQSFYNSPNKDGNNLSFSQLSGSKLLVGNVEFRLPFTGPERLALIKSKWLFTDINLFFDGGLAWNSFDSIELKWQTSSLTERIPVFSTGASVRVNLFGYLVIEPFYAIPFQNGGLDNGVFGLNFTPGW